MQEIITIKIDKELKQQIEETSKKLAISKSGLIRMAVIEKLNRIQGGK